MGMKIPKSVNSLTLEQYKNFRKIELEPIDELDKAVKLVNLLTGISIEVLEVMDDWKLKWYFKRLADLRATSPTTKIKKTLWIKGKRYQITKSEIHINTNRFVLSETYRANPIETYHLLAAAAYIDAPLFGVKKFNADKFHELAESMRSQKVGSVFGALFFYSVKLRESRENLENYSRSANQVIQKRMEEVERGLEAIGIDTAGTTSSTLSQLETRLKKIR